MNFIIWNTRGAAKRELGGALKTMIRKYSVDVVVLLEPRTSSEVCRKLMKKLGFDSLIVEEAQGFSGGIWIMWHSKKIEVVVVSPSSQSIHCKIKIPIGKIFDFTTVYASPTQNLREKLWDELRNLSDTIMGPWILGGDFNEIAYSHEKKGGVAVDPSKCAKFASILNECQVADLECDGSPFTWQGPKWGNTGRIYKRIDRVVANIEWRFLFDDARVSSLPRLFSDHNPLLSKLLEDHRNNGKKPFCFFAAWQEHHLFKDFLQTKWDHGFDLPYMLQRLVPDIKEWNKRIFGNIDRRKSSIMKRISNIQHDREQNDTSFLKNLEEKCQSLLLEVLHEEELFWFQKSRQKWIMDGDRNTIFYHLSTVVRINSNKIFRLKNDSEVWVSDLLELKNMACNFFKVLFSEDVCERRWISSWNLWPSIPSGDQTYLSKTPNEVEIKQANFNMGGFKAPGTDGFPAIFY
ncbi:uncharacterized protein LOC133296287 [Gastrolobium bilobum]|uniref:uncharacterized protein LOC133296287 n=1 Tax=Gastrolobium bilobum TaxID=150636 RepID=UPI002AAF5048|nr:uncharacterized protein LOC133296287 [Gastrolobium bilobum]